MGSAIPSAAGVSTVDWWLKGKYFEQRLFWLLCWVGWKLSNSTRITLPEFNIAPENVPSHKEVSFSNHWFSWSRISVREGKQLDAILSKDCLLVALLGCVWRMCFHRWPTGMSISGKRPFSTAYQGDVSRLSQQRIFGVKRFGFHHLVLVGIIYLQTSTLLKPNGEMPERNCQRHHLLANLSREKLPAFPRIPRFQFSIKSQGPDPKLWRHSVDGFNHWWWSFNSHFWWMAFPLK